MLWREVNICLSQILNLPILHMFVRIAPNLLEEADGAIGTRHIRAMDRASIALL